MTDILETYEIERGGRTFKVFVIADNDGGTPWENCDGHGVVTEWTRRDKRFGEWTLASDKYDRRFYDLRETLKLAKRDGWGIGKDAEADLAKRLGRAPTAWEVTKQAVRGDFKYLKSWCDDEWGYVGVAVSLVPAADLPDFVTVGPDYSNALWGIENSDAGAYIKQVAEELADQQLPAESV